MPLELKRIVRLVWTRFSKNSIKFKNKMSPNHYVHHTKLRKRLWSALEVQPSNIHNPQNNFYIVIYNSQKQHFARREDDRWGRKITLSTFTKTITGLKIYPVKKHNIITQKKKKQ